MKASEIFEKSGKALGNYIDLFMKWNHAFSFSKYEGFDEIVQNLIMPSLATSQLSQLKTYDRVIDLGSGPGIPGIPLAIARPDLTVTMLESGEHQVEFMNLCIRELKLSNCNVLHGRAEELAHVKGIRETFEIALARSYAPVGIVVETGSAFVKVGGRILVHSTADRARLLWDLYGNKEYAGCRYTEAVEVVDDRQDEVSYIFMSFEKVALTPEDMPRSWKKMKSDPLF